jgi:uncharacterized membrane protein
MIFSDPGKNADGRMARNGKGVLLLPIASVIWCTGLVLPSCLHALDLFPAVKLFLRLIYAPVCHQETGRSFLLFGFPLSVCSRCASIYAAFTLVTVMQFLPGRKQSFAPLRVLSSKGITVLFLLPMLFDFGLNVPGIVTSTMLSRTITGIIAGAGLSFFTVPAWIEAWDEISQRPSSALTRTRSAINE